MSNAVAINCWEQCTCENPWPGTVYHSCSYGQCCGYKCLNCGKWIMPQHGECELEEGFPCFHKPVEDY